jgi:hypothetical protein
MATYPLSEAYADGNVLSAANVNSITEGVNDIVFGQLNTQTGTTYTLVLSDVARVITLNNASSITLTVPQNSSVAFPTGTQIVLVQLGAGQVTVGGAGVTLRSNGSKLKLTGQYAVASLLKINTDEWVLFGNLSA